MNLCIICDKELTGKQKQYCSRKCHNKNGNLNHQNYLAQQKRGQERRLELIKILGGKCSKCGYCKNYAGLTFHHPDKSTKEFGLDTRKCSNSSWGKLLSEVKKCILLCHNCHMEEHHPHLNV